MNKTIIIGATAASLIAVAGLIASSVSESDTVAPAIQTVNAKRVTSGSAIVSLFTDEPAASKVYYSTTTPVTFATASIATGNIIEDCEGDKRSRFKQDVLLSDLAAETTYYFIVEVTDAAGNSSSNAEASFSTKEEKGEEGKPGEPKKLEPKCKPTKIGVNPKPRK